MTPETLSTMLAWLQTPAGREALFLGALGLFACALLLLDGQRKRAARGLSHGWQPSRPIAGAYRPARPSKAARAIAKALAAGRPADALQRLEFGSDDLDRPWRIYHQGLAFHRLGRFGEAEGYYQALLRDEPAHRQAAYNLAALRFELGQVPEALVGYRQLLAHHPADADGLFNLGQAYFHLKMYPEAMRCWEATLAIEPAADDAQTNLAWLRKVAGTRSPGVAGITPWAAPASSPAGSDPGSWPGSGSGPC